MTLISEGKLCYLFAWRHFQSYSFWNPDIYGRTTWKKWKVQVLVAHRVLLFVTPWTIAHQTPLSMEFSRQEYWSGEPFPSPGDLTDTGMEHRSLALQANSLPSEPPRKTVFPSKWWNGLWISWFWFPEMCIG